MTPPDLDTLLALRGHVQIAHHVRGRIRLRIKPTLVRDLGHLDTERIRKALQSIRGIGAVRLNPAAGSVVVEYAPDRIAPGTWELLLEGEPMEARKRLQTLLGPDLERLSSELPMAELHPQLDKEHT